MRWLVVVVGVLASGPSQACDSICQESRRDNARLHSEMLSDLRTLETNRALRDVAREVEALRDQERWNRASDDFYNRPPYRR